MRGAQSLQLKGWMLPLIVAVICVPVVAGFVIGGPGVGLAVGAVLAAAILIFAARLRPDEPIEVAPHTDDRRHLLVVVLAAVEHPGLAAKIAELAAAGDRTAGCEVLVLAPALNRPAAHWASDLREARFGAQRRLALSLGTLAAAEVDGTGQVGDTDPVQATEDVLRSFPADEVAFVTAGDAGSAEQIQQVSDRLEIPVRELRASGSGEA
jgi:hypothetical protein